MNELVSAAEKQMLFHLSVLVYYAIRTVLISSLCDTVHHITYLTDTSGGQGKKTHKRKNLDFYLLGLGVNLALFCGMFGLVFPPFSSNFKNSAKLKTEKCIQKEFCFHE